MDSDATPTGWKLSGKKAAYLLLGGLLLSGAFARFSAVGAMLVMALVAAAFWTRADGATKVIGTGLAALCALGFLGSAFSSSPKQPVSVLAPTRESSSRQATPPAPPAAALPLSPEEQKARNAKLAAEAVAEDVRVLVPVELTGFKLMKVEVSKGGDGVMAKYAGMGKEATALDLFVRKGQSLDKPDATSRTGKVRTYEAVLFDDPETKRAGAEWKIGDWYFVADMAFQTPTQRRASHALYPRAADEAAAWAEKYLGGERPPPRAERREYVQRLIKTAATNQAKEDAAGVEERAKKAMDGFKRAVERAGIQVVTDLSLDGRAPNDLIITVDNDWHYSPKQIRLQAAQNLWRLWSSINTPEAPDKSRIKLVDLNGNPLGGSGIMGSSVSVR